MIRRSDQWKKTCSLIAGVDGGQKVSQWFDISDRGRQS